MFACSGPTAPYVTAQSIRTGEIHAAVLGVLLVVSVAIAVTYGKRIIPLALLALLAVHPAWTISATRGDCGFYKVAMSWACTCVASYFECRR